MKMCAILFWPIKIGSSYENNERVVENVGLLSW